MGTTEVVKKPITRHNEPHDHDTETDVEGIEPITKSLTARLMNKTNENKVFITLIIAIITYVASQLMSTRDSAQVQPYVDRLQDQRIEQNDKRLDKIDRKLDIIINRVTQ